ncbi:MAG: flagellar biosynthesis repressor FlbT [Acidobacteriota bacterium]
MALAITLKPQERVILAGIVVRNTSRQPAHLLVETSAVVLREGDILPEKSARTPCGRIYLALQLLYLEPNDPAPLHKTLLALSEEVLSAAPSLAPTLEEIGLRVLGGDVYKALRVGKQLLKQEQALLEKALAS